MTKEQAVKLLKGKAYVFYGEMQLKALGMAIKALQQEPNEDLISRKDAIDGLEYEAELLNRVLDNMYVVGQEREKFAWGLGLVECFIEDIKELPSKEIINMKSVFNLSEDAERKEQ